MFSQFFVTDFQLILSDLLGAIELNFKFSSISSEKNRLKSTARFSILINQFCQLTSENFFPVRKKTLESGIAI